MTEMVIPGVYVEVNMPPPPITGVETGVAAFLGEAAEGPFEPLSVHGFAAFEDIYGADGYLAHAVRAFFANGGRKAWIARVPDGSDAHSTARYAGTVEKAPDGTVKRGTGLAALAQIDEIGLIAAPGASRSVQCLLVAHCVERPFCFAILDGPEDGWDAQSLDPRSDPALASSRAAYYVPWLEVPAPGGGTLRVPPSGAVCGIIARSDQARGVWKVPANEEVRGVTGLARSIGDAEQELLNPRSVNCIRALAGRGIRLWGARTLSTEADWRYVPVRRLANFIAQSIERGLQWVVFEPNGEPLWARVRLETETFLRHLWLDGAFAGSMAHEAFIVRADRTTMTQNDIDSGRLILQIGFTPLKPAEFVIIRIGLRTASA